jgi:hypothetical protein
VDLVWGGGEVDQNIPHRWRVNQDFFFLLAMNLFDWSITHKKKYTPHFGRLLK